MRITDVEPHQVKKVNGRDYNIIFLIGLLLQSFEEVSVYFVFFCKDRNFCYRFVVEIFLMLKLRLRLVILCTGYRA